jgi:hypothetical protein
MTRFDASVLFLLSTRGLNLAPGEGLLVAMAPGTTEQQHSNLAIVPNTCCHESDLISPFDDETSENRVVLFLNAIKKGALRFKTSACCCSGLYDVTF